MDDVIRLLQPELVIPVIFFGLGIPFTMVMIIVTTAITEGTKRKITTEWLALRRDLVDRGYDAQQIEMIAPWPPSVRKRFDFTEEGKNKKGSRMKPGPKYTEI